MWEKTGRFISITIFVFKRKVFKTVQFKIRLIKRTVHHIQVTTIWVTPEQHLARMVQVTIRGKLIQMTQLLKERTTRTQRKTFHIALWRKALKAHAAGWRLLYTMIFNFAVRFDVQKRRGFVISMFCAVALTLHSLPFVVIRLTITTIFNDFPRYSISTVSLKTSVVKHYHGPAERRKMTWTKLSTSFPWWKLFSSPCDFLELS